MHPTQRSEDINAYFDGYLRKAMPLCEFVRQYDRAFFKMREAENDEDFENNYRRPILQVGYLCRHILKIFACNDVQKLPPQYVLKRWTRDAKSGSVIDDIGEEIKADCHDPHIFLDGGNHSYISDASFLQVSSQACSIVGQHRAPPEAALSDLFSKNHAPFMVGRILHPGDLCFPIQNGFPITTFTKNGVPYAIGEEAVEEEVGSVFIGILAENTARTRWFGLPNYLVFQGGQGTLQDRKVTPCLHEISCSSRGK
ncbi:hypothetical protein HHK36_032543 [Tetracentron sinense]|uniref:Protein FAR1-RELATED SEQUENCE n=1 Tax=Tetracentron sinense TaxID=13715 RepID=A0A834Y8Z4_TETSI|nr:hypothetical protein HHK36_032543 [Tetracentron sinense]